MAGDKIIVVGSHPIAEDIISQYVSQNDIVENYSDGLDSSIDLNVFKEMVLLSDTDEKAIVSMSEYAERIDLSFRKGKKLICHLLLHSQSMLRMLQTCDLRDDIKQKIDVYPFMLDELWSRSIVLDYEPITIQSEKHVHLVIFGMGVLAQMVAIQAAHIAHYPNYVRNHSLRTRITMVGENAGQEIEGLIKKYPHLFDNSYYRIVKPSEERAVVKFHSPMYEGKREDFVDVEWEFVESESWNPDLREKLQFWAKDQSQLLSVVMADKDTQKNISESLFLPQELYQQSIPIYIYGQHICRYDVTMPLVQMAKNVNYIYNQCYNENVKDWKGFLHYSVDIDLKEREHMWAKLSSVKRMSSICNAMTIPTKMRSIGLEENEWDKFYDIPQQDIELLAQVEHNRWCVEELILGFRPCTDDEQKIISSDVTTQKDAYKARKIHYDLIAYKDLKPDKTGRGVEVYDLCLSACLPLIAKTFSDEKGGK